MSKLSEDPRIDPRVGLRRQLPLRDLAHPPQDVRRPLAERIGAQGDRVHAGLGLLQPAGLDGGHVLLGGVGLHHHRAELRALLLREPLADVREVHGHQLGEPPHAAVHVVGLLGGEHDVERRPVVDEHAAVAVEEKAARRGDGHGTDAVVLRQVAVVLAAQNLQLPRTDGWQLTREIKENSKTRHIAVIVVSACVMPAEREAAHAAGCDVFIAKPCDPMDIVNELRRLTRAPSP